MKGVKIKIKEYIEMIEKLLEYNVDIKLSKEEQELLRKVKEFIKFKKDLI